MGSPQSLEWPASEYLALLENRRHSSRSCAFPIKFSTVSSAPETAHASSRTHCSQVFLGRPLDLFPCLGTQSMKIFGIRCSGILDTWPNHRSRFEEMYPCTVLIPALFKTLTLLTLLYHLIKRARMHKLHFFNIAPPSNCVRKVFVRSPVFLIVNGLYTPCKRASKMYFTND